MATADYHEYVGDFEIDSRERDRLGLGGTGVVFPGRNLKTGVSIAAKKITVLKAEFNPGDFELEYDLLLNKIPEHRNIVKVYDFIKKEYVKDGVELIDLWLITELCPLGNLKSYALQRDLSIHEKIELMYQSSLAVHHLHEIRPEPVCHRDIKPENILVVECLGEPTIKVCDFGGARSVLRKNERSVTMKSQGGTVGYQAPEQIREQRRLKHLWRKEISYNKTVDTYSLGMSHLALLEAKKGTPMQPKTDDQGRPVSELLWENRNKLFGRYKPSIDKPADSPIETAIKTIIKGMIKLNPSDRLPLAEVIQRLSELRALTIPKLIAVKERSVWVKEGSAWVELPDMPKKQPEWYVCYCIFSDGIVAVGGWGDTASSMCHHFSLLTQCWTRLADMPTAKYYASAAVLGDMLLVVGGRDRPYHDLAVCERYSMGDGVWSPAAPMLVSLGRPLVATAAGKVFVLPWVGKISPGTQLQQYDPDTDQFSQAAPPPQHVQKTIGACLVGGGDKLYLLGGEQRLALQYSPATNQWSQLLSQPSARYRDWMGCCGVVRGGKLLLCGGSSVGNDYYNAVEGYDPHTQQWQIADFTLPFSFAWEYSFVGSIKF